MSKKVARVYSGELEGIDAKIVEIEADVNVGLHAFNIVGLADRSLNEAKERVNSALKNSGVKPPNRENRKITINLAPADMHKTGSHYDLGIALSYLLVTKQIAPFTTHDKIFLGELALDGRLRPVNGALNIAERAMREGFASIFLPRENTNEAAAINGIDVIPIETMGDVMAVLEKKKEVGPATYEDRGRDRTDVVDFSEIRGQENAKRALTIAAAGRHNVLLVGPPGVGKSMLARAMSGVLPQLSTKEAIEVTKVWSAAGLADNGLINAPPFRAPHHTISPAALVGGGPEPRPGEISLAHRGILFLDELPEFQRNSLEALRQPIETGELRVTRVRRGISFPSKFTLVAAMNPCPCGYYGDPSRECTCSAYEVVKYQKKISGPLLDRIDFQVKIGRVEMGGWTTEAERPQSEKMIEKIKKAKEAQRERFSKSETSSRTNADMNTREIRKLIKLTKEAESFLNTAIKDMMSPRTYHRLLKMARTIADLDNAELVSADHLAEAFSYRVREP